MKIKKPRIKIVKHESFEIETKPVVFENIFVYEKDKQGKIIYDEIEIPDEFIFDTFEEIPVVQNLMNNDYVANSNFDHTLYKYENEFVTQVDFENQCIIHYCSAFMLVIDYKQSYLMYNENYSFTRIYYDYNTKELVGFMGLKGIKEYAINEGRGLILDTITSVLADADVMSLYDLFKYYVD